MGRLSRLELAYYLRNTLLRDGDQMSMANSVELRQPMLDVRLVERVLEMPGRLKVRKGAQKPLLVEAVGAGLPHEVVDRPKMGFNLPYDRWLREGLVLADPFDVPMGLAPVAMRDVRERFFNGAYWTRYWALQVLAAWVERHDMQEPD
jgi:asparagine synthase (glutamine-hydrolysing)